MMSCGSGGGDPITDPTITDPVKITSTGATQPQWLDNDTIVYRYASDLYTVDIYSGESDLFLDLPSEPIGGTEYSLSPDETELAYSVLRDAQGFYLMMIVSVSSGEELTISPYGSSFYHPAFSPDGNSVASIRGFSKIVVFERNEIGNWTNRIIHEASVHGISWSPSMDRIAFIHESNIWTVNLDGGEATQLSDQGTVANSIHWSSDGSFIAYSKNSGGIGAYYLSDGSTRTIVYASDSPSMGSLSPDGTLIAGHKWGDGQPDIWVWPVE
jgi:Tol biopolymer transport system component